MVVSQSGQEELTGTMWGGSCASSSVCDSVQIPWEDPELERWMSCGQEMWEIKHNQTVIVSDVLFFGNSYFLIFTCVVFTWFTSLNKVILIKHVSFLFLLSYIFTVLVNLFIRQVFNIIFLSLCQKWYPFASVTSLNFGSCFVPKYNLRNTLLGCEMLLIWIFK